MLLLPLVLLLQTSAHAIQKAEHQRTPDVAIFLNALKEPDPRVQRLALRSLGRLERPALSAQIAPWTRATDAAVRREAVAALAQSGAPFDFASLLRSESDAAVRAVAYEAIGRARPVVDGSEAVLVAGLKDADPQGRIGAARGLETLVRLNVRTRTPLPSTVEALRHAIRDNPISRLRQFALLALNAASSGDAATFELALLDPDPHVRRLAVAGSKRFVDDPSPIVRYEALRVAPTCERAVAALGDASGHVVLAAVDYLGTAKCDAPSIEDLADRGASWRIRARALVALAKAAPEAARARIFAFSSSPTWQVRVYAANAARLLKEDKVLRRLAEDPNGNVAAAALSTAAEALRALASNHSGLLLAAAERLKGTPESKVSAELILETVQRLTKSGRVTVRDERLRLIDVLAESRDQKVLAKLSPLLLDRDPEVAARVARVMTETAGRKVAPRTTQYVPEPFPKASTLRALEGARATIRMKEAGSFTIELLPEEAPATVAVFAALAEKGAYDGLTIHRVVPNFVLQGGSPGANEYDALSREFMRDEVGFAANERGTLGVSTRGHDTGDGQIFVNLIDNWRLDHTYTVFARVISGMDAVDAILEGDVIEKITIVRRSGS
jgi:cyclophilin family peptidyl-prolyl cis-trans isomerase